MWQSVLTGRPPAETTEPGRTLNRFTLDVEVLDIELTVSMAGLLISFSWFSASIVVMVWFHACAFIDMQFAGLLINDVDVELVERGKGLNRFITYFIPPT